jgi:hypothetical protein
MKIIDFERKGNVVRFYLGEKTEDWGWTRSDYKRSDGTTPDWLKPSDSYYGDDWDDRPYEHNAGQVYEEFIKGYKDVSFDFDDLVLEPCCGAWNCNSRWCKDDMVARRVPCIIAVPKEIHQYSWDDAFDTWAGADGIKKYYFGDDESVLNK